MLQCGIFGESVQQNLRVLCYHRPNCYSKILQILLWIRSSANESCAMPDDNYRSKTKQDCTACCNRPFAQREKLETEKITIYDWLDNCENDDVSHILPPMDYNLQNF